MGKIILCGITLVLTVSSFALALHNDSNASVRYHEKIQCQMLTYPGVSSDVLVVDKEFCENNLK